MIEEYKEEGGIKMDNSTVDMLQNIFSGIEPVINKIEGGREYTEELIQIIKETCNVSPEDIRINDVYKNTQKYGRDEWEKGCMFTDDSFATNCNYKNSAVFN